MNEFNKFYVYEGNRPVGIVDGADEMPVNEIDKLARALKLCFDRDIHIRPIHPGDFQFDESGRKIDRISKFEYPLIKPN